MQQKDLVGIVLLVRLTEKNGHVVLNHVHMDLQSIKKDFYPGE